MSNRAHSGRCFRARRNTARRKVRQLMANKHHQVLALTAVDMGVEPSLEQAARSSIQELGYKLKTGWHKLLPKALAVNGIRRGKGAARGR